MSIFNNPQLETLDEGAKLYMLGMNPAFYDRLKPKDYDINALMNAPADPTPCIIMAEREFDIDQSLEEYVADFPAHIFGGGQDSFWGMGFEINRAAVMVAKRTRRGMGNRVYYNPDHFQHGLPASLNPVMTPIAADFLPPYTVLVTYEGNNHFDVGFIYCPSRGIARNHQDNDYGVLVEFPRSAYMGTL